MALKVELFKCPKCNNHFYEEEKADKCCAPKHCEDCGKELPYKWYRTVCEPCTERRKFEKARKMTYDEYLTEFGNNMLVVGGDNYFSDMDSIIDHYYGEEEIPQYAYGTEKIDIKINIDSAIENALENAYEDAEFSNLNKLQSFIDEWNAENGLTAYAENSKIIIWIPREEISNA